MPYWYLLNRNKEGELVGFFPIPEDENFDFSLEGYPYKCSFDKIEGAKSEIRMLRLGSIRLTTIKGFSWVGYKIEDDFSMHFPDGSYLDGIRCGPGGDLEPKKNVMEGMEKLWKGEQGKGKERE